MSTKFCCGCNSEKPLEDFARNRSKKDGHAASCKACTNAYNAEFYKINPNYKIRINAGNTKQKHILREYVLEYLKKNPCAVCGETDPVVLDFHHKGNKVKEVSIIKNGSGSLDKLVEEIEKCEVLCANCHRRKHYNEKHALIT